VYELFVGKQPTVGADVSASSAVTIEQTKADTSAPTPFLTLVCLHLFHTPATEPYIDGEQVLCYHTVTIAVSYLF